MNGVDLNSCHDSYARITKVDLCYMICASPFVYVGLHLLPINMSIELSFDFRG